MNESKDTGPRMRVLPPPYVDFDAKEREQFLSELGNFTPPQRELFHSLCKTWQPEISYNRFIAQTSPTVKNAPHELDRLMEKLSEKRCGLIVVRFSGKEAEKEKILLTAQNDCRYYYYRLQNEMEYFYADPSGPIPLESTLAERGLTVPASCAETLSLGDFSRVFTEKSENETVLYRVPVADGKGVFLPSGGGTRFINACLERLKAYLSNTNLLAEIARVKETSIADMKKKTESKDPLFWLDLSKTVLALKSDPLVQKRVQTDQGLFHFADILGRFIDNHLAELKKRKIEQEEREKDLEALALQMEKEKDPLISRERFHELLGTLRDKYGDKIEEVRKEFSEKYIDYKERTNLPAVLFLNQGYIHRNNFYDFFLGRLFVARDMLGQDYLKTMERLIRTNNRDGLTIFYSKENFETDILERLKPLDPFLFEVFDKPRLLAEAVIHTLKEKRKIKDLSDLKDELEKYFKPDTMIYKSLPSIFGFAVVDFFYRAYAALPFWRQIWLRLTGKYESYQNQYFGLGARIIAGPREESARGSGSRKEEPRNRGGSGGDESYRGKRIPLKRRPRTKKEAPPKKKSYTRKQQESAWEEFSKSIKPKRP